MVQKLILTFAKQTNKLTLIKKVIPESKKKSWLPQRGKAKDADETAKGRNVTRNLKQNIYELSEI